MEKIKNYFFKFLNKSIVRFVSVGVVGEFLYLLLFAIFTSIGLKNTFSILPSGIICILFNSYMHAKFSFKIGFNLKFFLQYIFVQLICVLFTYIFSFLFVSLGMNNISIAFSTLIIWGGLSFLIMSTFVNNQNKQ